MAILEPSTMTAADLASKLGVSRATVSYVLSGDGERRKISPKTIDRVLRMAAELKYVPNESAQNLRRGRSGMILLLIGNLEFGFANGVMAGMAGVLDDTGYSPFVTTHWFDEKKNHRELISAMRRRVEAVVCQPLAGEEKAYAELDRLGIPLIFLGDHPRDLKGASFVGWDSAAAARVAVQHLVDCGRKRIGHIGVDYPMVMSQARYAAYEAVLRENGLPMSPDMVHVARSYHTADEVLDPAIERFFRPGGPDLDAIFVLNDGLALPLLEKLDARGIRVPEDVALVGMGDLPLTGHAAIGLTTVKEPTDLIGRHAAEAALELIATPGRKPIYRPIDGCELKVRRTTAGRVLSI
jgi:LacI family transcriptional regulator